MTASEKNDLLSKKINDAQIFDVARNNDIDPYYLKSFTEVEGSGIGFSDYTGRMLIQFEPGYMEKFLAGQKVEVKGDWVNNGISNQTIEWQAFESASKQDPEAAMKSCSIGMMQVMGAHYAMLGFKSVKEMWDYANVSEKNQLDLGIRFIRNNLRLYQAVKMKDSSTVAFYYNGSGYLALAKRTKTVPYNERIDRAYNRLTGSAAIHKTKTTVNIRKGPGANFVTVASPLRVNTALNILSSNNGWSQVSVISTGLTGWISSSYII